MPNLWGQPHPWERADLTHGEWMQVLRESIARWNRAAEALTQFYGTGGPITLERRGMQDERIEAQREHDGVIAGDVAICAKVWERIRE